MTHRRRTLAAAMAALLITAPAALTAQQIDPGTERVTALLSAIHGPPPREVLEESSPRAKDITLTVASSPLYTPMMRSNALAALARYWPDGDVFDLYERLLTDRSTPVSLRLRLQMSAARAWGEHVTDLIAPELARPEAHRRRGAIEALGLIDSDRSIELLNAHLRVESDPFLRERTTAAMRSLR